MQGADEKRNYPRMGIECPARFTVVGGEDGGAVVKNLSGGGLLIWIEREIAPGSALKIEVIPCNDTTPPLLAEVEVLRCTAVDDGGSFAVACQIHRVLG
ncbi:MAG: PilZ domain-containing protein [Sedimenticolaceae bacterium]